MSWGPGRYADYIARCKARIRERGLKPDEVFEFVKSRWNYVKTRANIEKVEFFRDFGFYPRED